MLKVRTLFSGIGSPEIALRDLQIPFELIDFCEIDKYAVKSYCAIHNVDANKNLGDISKVWGRNLPYADLLVWGFPCTDISVAGKGAGIVEGGTRSGLYYEGLRILRETRPKYSIIENVKNLTGKKFKAEFEQMLTDIEGLGYNNYWQVLNAKNYGIPQNRERVFIVSIRADVDTKEFDFPVGFDNGLRLKDFLEDEVEEKFYIPQEKVEQLLKNIDGKIDLNKQVIGTCHKRNDLSFATRDRVYNGELQSPTLTATMYKDAPKILKVGNTTPSGKSQCNDVFSPDGLYPNICAGVHGNCNPSIVIPCITPDRVEKRQNGRRFKEDGDAMFTLTSQDRHGVMIVDDMYKNREPREYTDIAPTLRAERQGLNVLESVRLGGIFDGEKKHQAGAIWDKEGLCPTLDTMQGGYRQPSTVLDNYRIRKLTPKECYRLMGFSDEDFENAKYYSLIESEKLFKTFPKRKFKINSTHEERFKNRIERMSDSQLYKQAGNSIVSNVLAAIFKTLLQKEIAQLKEDDKELS